MVNESWDAFTKRVLVEKHIDSIMYENPAEGEGCRRPWLWRHKTF